MHKALNTRNTVLRKRESKPSIPSTSLETDSNWRIDLAMDDKMNIKTSGLKCDRSTWKTVRLGEVGDFFKGHGVTMKDTCVTGVPCTMYGDIYVKYGIIFEQVD